MVLSVSPSLRFEEGLCLLKAVPFCDCYALGWGRPFQANNLSTACAKITTFRIRLCRRGGSSEIKRGPAASPIHPLLTVSFTRDGLDWTATSAGRAFPPLAWIASGPSLMRFCLRCPPLWRGTAFRYVGRFAEYFSRWSKTRGRARRGKRGPQIFRISPRPGPSLWATR